MAKSYRTKLHITSKKLEEALKSYAGTYRKIYNTSIDLQQEWLNYSRNPKHFFLPSEQIINVLRIKRNDYFPFIKGMDGGMIAAAALRSKDHFKRWWETLSPFSTYRFPKYKSRKKDNMSFKTCGKVKVFYDHISVPKLGDIKLYEKGYIPQGKRYSNITFSHDGSDWWISLTVRDEKEIREELTGKSVYVDFTNEGSLVINGEVIERANDKENYKRLSTKKKSLEKKLKRQSLANMVRSGHGMKTRTTRNMLKTKKLITAIKTKLEDIKKDSFKKQASIVARTKPKKLYCLSSNSISKQRQGGLTRAMRESSTLQFFNTIVRKAEAIGTQIVRLEVPTKRLLAP